MPNSPEPAKDKFLAELLEEALSGLVSFTGVATEDTQKKLRATISILNMTETAP